MKIKAKADKTNKDYIDIEVWFTNSTGTPFLGFQEFFLVKDFSNKNAYTLYSRDWDSKKLTKVLFFSTPVKSSTHFLKKIIQQFIDEASFDIYRELAPFADKETQLIEWQ